jgi:hypothetical protein
MNDDEAKALDRFTAWALFTINMDLDPGVPQITGFPPVTKKED